jgi:hypothetical protein
MKCAMEMAPRGTIYIPSFMNIGRGVQAIFEILPQKIEKL